MTNLYWQDPKGLSPPTMMLGCHETRAELGLGTGQRGFAGGVFDEVVFNDDIMREKNCFLFSSSNLYSFWPYSKCLQVAFWDRRIGDDEIHMFLGGYSEIQHLLTKPFKIKDDKVKY